MQLPEQLQKPNIDDLLIKCSLATKDNLPQLFHSISAGVGWERFFQIAEREGLSEIIYYHCRERIAGDLKNRDFPPQADQPTAEIPSEVGRFLENAYLTTLARNILFLAKLEQIAHTLAGLDFIVLKGAYLASHVYSSPGLRGFSDIDILVKQANLTEVSRRLAKLGYKPRAARGKCADSPGFARSEASERAKGSAEAPSRPSFARRSGLRDLPTPAGAGFAKAGGGSAMAERGASIAGLVEKVTISSYLNSIMFHSAETNIAVHVHWHLLNSILPNYINTTLDVSEIWKAARPFTLTLRNESTSAGLELCPEHLIIHLAEHALRHSFDRLVLLRDIAEVIIKLGSAIDWNRVVADSRKFNLVRPVFYSLLLVREKTAVAVPDSALAALRPACLGRGERLFMQLTLRGRRYPELCNLVYFDSQASCGEKIGFVLRLAFPPRDVLALAYGKRTDEIGPAVYILRLFRGIRYATCAMVYHAGSARNQIEP